jgi:uncharacterized SAM-binding protein YcdF (DUF218 family)
MKKYLVEEWGIAEERIWTEEKSVDSWENVTEMKKELLRREVDISKIEIIIVSHWTHALRLRRLLRYNGFKNKKVRHGGKSHPVGWRWYFRELLLFLLTLIDPQGKSWFVRREREKRRQWQKKE